MRKSTEKSPETTVDQYEIIVIGVSAGGKHALEKILGSLPDDFPIPLVIIQHLHKDSEDYHITHLQRFCPLKFSEVVDKEKIKKGYVYFGPANYHLSIEKDNTFSLSTEDKVNFARPAIDVLFESCAYTYGNKAVGVILTGANSDGSSGLKTIKKFGGLTLVQDPDTAECESMPKFAIASTRVDHILPLEEIGPFLINIVRENS